jgi:EAL domain-containing protein (putative c-di-GMP-specific phosphodiesterase class I)
MVRRILGLRRSFVSSITVLALLALVAVGAVIVLVVRSQITDQAFDRARDTAQLTARVAFAPRLPAPGRSLPEAELDALDRQLAAARSREPLLDMRVWGPGGTIVYARDRSLIGSRERPGETVAAALRGRGATAVVDDDRVLRTAVPIVRSAGAAPAAALQLDLPYGAVAADVDARTWRLVAALAIVGLLAYLLALPSLLRASRALRAQYDPRRLELVRDLKRAMKRGELSLHFQPIVEASTGRPASAEALVRWHHPQRGPVPPDKWIFAVESTEVMWPLTLHLLGIAAERCAEWRAAGHEGVRVAVNVSAEVLPDRRLPDEVRRLLAEYGLPAEALEIEVTEGAVMRDPHAATRVLDRLTELGIRVIAIDDFGTGYSSLARLHELPLDTLKIDQSFVRRMAEEGDDAIVRSIIELAHALGMKVIAEGAEDERTVVALAALGCDFVQGYAYTKPLPPEEFGAWLDAGTAVRS